MYVKKLVGIKFCSITLGCNAFQMSKNTYYNSKDPDESYKQKYEHIKKYIIWIIKKNSKYGVTRIKAELMRKYKIHIGRDALSRSLQLWELSLPRKIKKSRPSLLRKILIRLSSKVNILVRTNITKPFQAMSSDITELYYKAGKCYLCVHKDVFGQEVYGFQISHTADTSIVVKSFQQAIKKVKKYIGKIPRDMIMHQDQGSQYTSYRYVNEVLKTCSISYSCKGTPTDNPGQESFFGRFKEEWHDDIAELENLNEVERFVKKKLEYYNKDRLHTSIHLVPPHEFTRNYLLKLRRFLVQKC